MEHPKPFKSDLHSLEERRLHSEETTAEIAKKSEKMKNFGKKWFISASSGILGKILLVAFGLCVGFAGSKVVTFDNAYVTTVIFGTLNFAVVFSMVAFIRNLDTFKEWAQERRQDEIRKLELEKEIIELEIQRDNQQSTANDKE